MVRDDYTAGVADYRLWRARILAEFAESGRFTPQIGDPWQAGLYLVQGREERAELMFWRELRTDYLLNTVPGLRLQRDLLSAKMNAGNAGREPAWMTNTNYHDLARMGQS